MTLPEVHAVTLEAQSAAQNAVEVLGRLSAALGTSSQLLGAWFQERDELYARQRHLEQQLETAQHQAANENREIKFQQACIEHLGTQIQRLRSELHATNGEHKAANAALDAERRQLQQHWQHLEEQRRLLDRQRLLEQEHGRAVGTPCRGSRSAVGRNRFVDTEERGNPVQGQQVFLHYGAGHGLDTPRSESDVSLPPSQPRSCFIDRVPETLLGDWEEQEGLFAQPAVELPPCEGGPPEKKVHAADGSDAAAPNTAPPVAAVRHATVAAAVGETEMPTAGPAFVVKDAVAGAAGPAAANAAAAWASREEELARDHAAQLEAVWAENHTLQTDLQRALTYRRVSQQLRAKNETLEQQIMDVNDQVKHLQQLLKDAQAATTATTAAASSAAAPTAAAGPTTASVAGAITGVAAAGQAVGKDAPAQTSPDEGGDAMSDREALLLSERDRYVYKYHKVKEACREARQLARHWQSAYWGLVAAQEGLETVPARVKERRALKNKREAHETGGATAAAATVLTPPLEAKVDHVREGPSLMVVAPSALRDDAALPKCFGVAGADSDAVGQRACPAGYEGGGDVEGSRRGTGKEATAAHGCITHGQPYPPLPPSPLDCHRGMADPAGFRSTAPGLHGVTKKATTAEGDEYLQDGHIHDGDDEDVDVTQAPSEGERGGVGAAQGQEHGGLLPEEEEECKGGGDVDQELSRRLEYNPRLEAHCQQRWLAEPLPRVAAEPHQVTQEYQLEADWKAENAEPHSDELAPQAKRQQDRQQCEHMTGVGGREPKYVRQDASHELIPGVAPAKLRVGSCSPAPDLSRPVRHAPDDTGGIGGLWLNKRRNRSWDLVDDGSRASDPGDGRCANEDQVLQGFPRNGGEKLVPGRRYVQQQLPFVKQKPAPLHQRHQQLQPEGSGQPQRRPRLQPSQPWHQLQHPVPEPCPGGLAPAAATAAIDDSDYGKGRGVVSQIGRSDKGREFRGTNNHLCAERPLPKKRMALAGATGISSGGSDGTDTGAAAIPRNMHGGAVGPMMRPQLVGFPAGPTGDSTPRWPSKLSTAPGADQQYQQPRVPGPAAQEGGASGRSADTYAVAADAARDVRWTEGLGYKYSAVVRGRSERDALQAMECAGCRAFYEAVATWGGVVEPCCTHTRDREQRKRGEPPTAAEPAAAAVSAVMPTGAGGPPGAGAAAEAQSNGRPSGSGGGALAAALRQVGGRHRFKYMPPATPEGFWDIGFGDTPE